MNKLSKIKSEIQGKSSEEIHNFLNHNYPEAKLAVNIISVRSQGTPTRKHGKFLGEIECSWLVS